MALYGAPVPSARPLECTLSKAKNRMSIPAVGPGNTRPRLSWALHLRLIVGLNFILTPRALSAEA